MLYTVWPIKIIELMRFGEGAVEKVNPRFDKGKHNIVIKMSETFQYTLPVLEQF